ncbi:hypothetical protein AB870_16475 [Pandoraea faecigallinarum]|uniref:Uncharacterized protein n=1 Tax=Pandoraea faecigallinarum TaxID=656179 RepID=A0A0H3WUR0_9BURK|nr:hypothetical protein [Pandoraea faecigallinarum]AKM31370.1 hypothetical protein AB870_16475 [Pandoraea faecigallinarum]
MEVVPFTVREECEGEYEVPGRKIWSDDVLLAKLVPIASKVIAADGRVDVVGWLGSHALLFQGEAVLGPKSATIVTHRPGRASTARIVRNIEVDGWYWFEARVRRPVFIDEALFLDLLTDVSNYEF